ncbi:MAG: DoxX family protein [Cyanobacteria bacterium P01_F01_bin.153]
MNSPLTQLRRRDLVVAYTLLRILFGINFFNHGFVRLDSLPQFAQGMVEMFSETFVPEPLVYGPALLVPIVELIIGIGMILGLGTEISLVAGMILMMVLTYGVTLVENWSAASSQLIYCLVFTVLIAGRCFNDLSVDKAIARRQKRSGRTA